MIASRLYYDDDDDDDAACDLRPSVPCFWDVIIRRVCVVCVWCVCVDEISHLQNSSCRSAEAKVINIKSILVHLPEIAVRLSVCLSVCVSVCWKWSVIVGNETLKFLTYLLYYGVRVCVCVCVCNDYHLLTLTTICPARAG